jgi:hypothetical protein
MPVAPDPQQQAKHPVTRLAGPYGHPIHPILVTVPIGSWTASLVSVGRCLPAILRVSRTHGPRTTGRR